MLAGDVDRPELGLDAPLAESRDVGLAGIQPVREVELLEVEIPLGPQSPGEVVVAVEEHPGGVDLPRPLGNRRQAVRFPFSSWPWAPAAMAITRRPGLLGSIGCGAPAGS